MVEAVWPRGRSLLTERYMCVNCGELCGLVRMNITFYTNRLVEKLNDNLSNTVFFLIFDWSQFNDNEKF